MDIFEPSYYKKFSCLADQCRTNCCQGWDVTFNKADYDKLRSKRFPAKLRETLKGCLKRSNNERSYGTFLFPENTMCPMLENGMCSLQIAVGAENLPKVCRVYPRQKYVYGNMICHSCINSCEQVLHLMLKEALTFTRREATVFETKNAGKDLNRIIPKEIEDHFEMIQTLCIAIMQNREYSLENRLLILGMAMKALQSIWEEKRLDKISAWFGTWARVATGNSLENELSLLEGQYLVGIQSCSKILFLLSPKDAHGNEKLNRVFAGAGVTIQDRIAIGEEGMAEQSFIIDKEELSIAIKHLDEVLEPYSFFMENMVVNLIFREAFPLIFEDNFFDSYLFLCYNYALLRFMVIGYVGGDGTIDDAIDGIAHLTRIINHNHEKVKIILEDLKETGTDTLAHMAYLIRI